MRDLAVPSEMRFVLSASYDETARLWPLTPERLIVIGCMKAGREPTEDEWREHIGGTQTALCEE